MIAFGIQLYWVRLTGRCVQARVSFDKDLNKGAHPVRTWPLQAAALIPVSACSSDADGAGGYSRGWRQWHG